MMEWIPVLVALIGSTGIIGALTAGLQLSRRARLRRSIRDNREALEAATDEQILRQTLQPAIDLDSLRLAATSIITLRARQWFIVWSSLITFAAGIAMGLIARAIGIDMTVITFGPSLPREWTFLVLSMTVCLGLIGFLSLSFFLQSARERYVAAQMAKAHEVDTPNVPARNKSRNPRR